MEQTEFSLSVPHVPLLSTYRGVLRRLINELQIRRGQLASFPKEHVYAKEDSFDSDTCRSRIHSRHSNRFRAGAESRRPGRDRQATIARERAAVRGDYRAQAHGADARWQAHGDGRLSPERLVEEIPYGLRADAI